MIRKPRQITPEQALQRLEALCAASEQCTAELRNKLRRWSISEENAEKIIVRLSEKRFVDDERFAKAFVRDRYRFSRWGRARIAMELKVRKISRTIIGEAMKEIDDDEYVDILIHLLRSKVRSARLGKEYAERAKLFRFAASRGFESSLISRCISDGLPWIEENGSEE